ncbi:RluA family pseudouridine synthase [Treponema sp.]|uniref:RluA family pseudouridine synthase n=1 Tax=Treponema sp. TaxID=166 RepID=UPI0025F732EE|nr:RluA family pseudouridine synthase [Treponema sp.]MCR5217346.1 RluA family pseudouridine synthase [Treponema sp.]
MDFKIFTTGKDDAGRRLDRVIKKIFSDRKIQSNAQEVIRKKLVKVNGSKCQASRLLNEGDSIEIAAFLLGQEAEKSKNESDEESEYDSEKKEDIPFPYEILFKNEHIMMINKPSGINVQPAVKGEKALSVSIKEAFKDNRSLSFTPAPLHRLDKYTSGILAVSMSMEGARWFSRALADHKLVKSYLAVLNGTVKKEETWTDSLDSQETENKKYGKSKVYLLKKDESSSAKECITIVKPLKNVIFNGKAVTFSLLRILTGRKHQIRAQSAARGHPLLGDSAYGGGSGSFYLHAWKLNLPADNPLNIQEEITCPLPDNYMSFLKTSLKIDNLESII